METRRETNVGRRLWLSLVLFPWLAIPLQLPGQNNAPARQGPGNATVSGGPVVKRDGKAVPVPRDAEARARFLNVERFARLPKDEQTRQFTEFYRNLAPFYMNEVIEGILSSYPAKLLDRQGGQFAPGEKVHESWAAQLDHASATLSPEEVADKLESRLWLDVAGRTRAHQVCDRHRQLLHGLIQQDLDVHELPAIQRACLMISDLRLRQFTTNLLELYLANTPTAEPACTALVWLADPMTLRPLLKEIEKDQNSIKRHAGLFQGPLSGEPAPPLLVKLLDSPDPDLRYHAAFALSECQDAALAGPTAKLAQEKEARLQSVALALASRLPDGGFAQTRPALVPLLQSPDPTIRLQAITCFAKRKDLLAGPPLLGLLRQPGIDLGQAVTVMQALSALTGSTFNYYLHEWGPKTNARAIARFEAWLRSHPVGDRREDISPDLPAGR